MVPFSLKAKTASNITHKKIEEYKDVKNSCGGFSPQSQDAQAAMQDLETMGINRSSVQVMTSDARDKVLNALTGAGVPSDDASLYAEGVRRGSALVVGTVDDDKADEAVAVLDRNNTIDINQLGSRYRGKRLHRL